MWLLQPLPRRPFNGGKSKSASDRETILCAPAVSALHQSKNCSAGESVGCVMRGQPKYQRR